MRYCVKWNNGVWKLFDNEEYIDLDWFSLKNQAEEVLNSKFNQTKVN